MRPGAIHGPAKHVSRDRHAAQFSPVPAIIAPASVHGIDWNKVDTRRTPTSIWTGFAYGSMRAPTLNYPCPHGVSGNRLVPLRPHASKLFLSRANGAFHLPGASPVTVPHQCLAHPKVGQRSGHSPAVLIEPWCRGCSSGMESMVPRGRVGTMHCVASSSLAQALPQKRGFAPTRFLTGQVLCKFPLCSDFPCSITLSLLLGRTNSEYALACVKTELKLILLFYWFSWLMCAECDFAWTSDGSTG